MSFAAISLYSYVHFAQIYVSFFERRISLVSQNVTAMLLLLHFSVLRIFDVVTRQGTVYILCLCFFFDSLIADTYSWSKSHTDRMNFVQSFCT